MTGNRHMNLVGAIFVVAVLVLAGVALYVRLSNAGGDERYNAENYDIFQDIGDAQGEYHASTLRLGGTVLESEVYHFSKNCIQLSMETYITGGEAANDYFTIELHRIEAGVIDVLVGSRTFKRTGQVVANWEDVPEGDYYFVFKKDADSQVINSDYVIMGSAVVVVD